MAEKQSPKAGASRKSFAGSLAGLVTRPAASLSNVTPTQAAGSTSFRQDESGLDPKMAAAMLIQEQGGLLNPSTFTKEAALKAKRPLVVHAVKDLVVHPNNPRPVSADDNLEDLLGDMTSNGQRDPIHVVPYRGGWAIMEGQRRWRAAPKAGISELECFEHPEMAALDVYSYGRAVHLTRNDTCAIDDSIAWQKLLSEEGISRAQLMERLSLVGAPVSEVMLSKRLAITQCHQDLIAEVKRKPSAFSDRHLYALAQLEQVAGPNRAISEANRVRLANEERPVSAVSLEGLVASLKAEAPGGGRRRQSSDRKRIVGADGKDAGVCSSYKDGRLEFKPSKPLSVEQMTELQAQFSRLLSDFFKVAEADGKA